MKLLRIWCVIVVIVFALTGCGSTDCGSTDMETWITYSCEEYEFDYPKTWIIGDPDEIQFNPTPEVFIYDANSDSDLPANVNVLIQSHFLLAPSAQEQAEAATQFFATLGSSTGFKDYKQLDFTPVKIGDINAGVSTNEFTASQNDITVMNRQLFVPFGQKSYILTMTCKKEDWEKYVFDFQKIISSFKPK